LFSFLRELQGNTAQNILAALPVQFWGGFPTQAAKNTISLLSNST
jgi:hypothetical protein